MFFVWPYLCLEPQYLFTRPQIQETTSLSSRNRKLKPETRADKKFPEKRNNITRKTKLENSSNQHGEAHSNVKNDRSMHNDLESKSLVSDSDSDFAENQRNLPEISQESCVQSSTVCTGFSKDIMNTSKPLHRKRILHYCDADQHVENLNEIESVSSENSQDKVEFLLDALNIRNFEPHQRFESDSNWLWEMKYGIQIWEVIQQETHPKRLYECICAVRILCDIQDR